jgi:hypothetical protein
MSFIRQIASVQPRNPAYKMTRADAGHFVAESTRWTGGHDMMQQHIPRGIRKRSNKTFLGLPIVDIALGPDPEMGEMRGHAHGIIAIGDIAKGWIAIGGIAVGGGAMGVVAIGGGAVGYYAFGGGAFGKYVVSAMQRSPEAVEFFKHWFPCLPMK